MKKKTRPATAGPNAYVSMNIAKISIGIIDSGGGSYFGLTLGTAAAPR